MKWLLTGPHHIDEQVLPAGTVIGDGTSWPFRARVADPRIGRKAGDPLPPSNDMQPIDDEAKKLFAEIYGGEAPNVDPTASIPLTGAEGSPRVTPQTAPRPTEYAAPDASKAGEPGVNLKQVTTPPAQSPGQQTKAPEKPANHDSSKNPGDSKDTETAKAPDIKKV